MNSVFEESQKFRQKAITWILYICLAVITIFSAAIIIVEKNSLGFVSFLVVLVFFSLFRIMRLETRITSDAIYYRFFPIQLKARRILKSEIRRIEIATYDPIADYGGWGIRFGKKGMAYTVIGVRGISITLSSDKNILIGTSQPEAAAKFLKENGYPLE